MNEIIYGALQVAVLFAYTLWLIVLAVLAVTAILWRYDYGDSWHDIWDTYKRAMTRPLFKEVQ